MSEINYISMLPKFRCYIHATGEMLPVTAIVQMNDEDGPRVFPKGYDRNFLVSEGEVELMQYIGLKDKNGNEIYESDIVKVSDKSICIVDFHSGQFVFTIIHPDPRTGGIRWCNESVYFNLQSEIIANIYKNPDLMK